MYSFKLGYFNYVARLSVLLMEQQTHSQKKRGLNLNPPLGISVTEGRFHNTLVFLDEKDKHPVNGIEDFLKKCETENKKSAVFITVEEKHFVHYLPILKR